MQALGRAADQAGSAHVDKPDSDKPSCDTRKYICRCAVCDRPSDAHSGSSLNAHELSTIALARAFHLYMLPYQACKYVQVAAARESCQIADLL